MSKNITVNDIKGKLDELKVDYANDLNKDDLLKLLEEAKKKPPEESNEEIKVTEDEEIKTYVVIHDFKDLEDNATVYLKGDIYPRRANTKVDDKRIEELMSTENKIGKQLIKEQD